MSFLEEPFTWLKRFLELYIIGKIEKMTSPGEYLNKRITPWAEQTLPTKFHEQVKETLNTFAFRSIS